jgi:hypothetical protein
MPNELENFDKTQLQTFMPNAFFTTTALSQTPRPLYRWKGETVLYLQIYLSGGVTVVSFCIRMRQSYELCFSCA